MTPVTNHGPEIEPEVLQARKHALIRRLKAAGDVDGVEFVETMEALIGRALRLAERHELELRRYLMRADAILAERMRQAEADRRARVGQ